MLKRLFCIGVAAIAGAAFAGGSDVTVTAPDGFELRGSYFAAEGPGPAILLLHQCNSDRSMWDSLAASLAERGLHVLSFDYRGYGESKLRDSSQKRGPRTGDVAAAYEYLIGLPGVRPERVGLAGASCGGPMEIVLAQGRPEVKTLVFLSTYLNRSGAREAFGNLTELPILLITAEEDGDTTESLQEAFARSTNPRSRLVLYKGDAHGHPLFEQDERLEQTIVEWFADRLR